MLEIRNALPNCTKERIQEFEAAHNLKLPEDYVRFLLLHNGGQPTPEGFQMSYPKKPKINAGYVQIFFGLDAADHPFDMDLEETMEIYVGRGFPRICCQLEVTPAVMRFVLASLESDMDKFIFGIIRKKPS